MGPWLTSEAFRIGTDRRESVRLTPMEPSPRFVCHSCPFEGDEEAMIDHAMDRGHIAQPMVEDEDRMIGEGCPND